MSAVARERKQRRRRYCFSAVAAKDERQQEERVNAARGNYDIFGMHAVRSGDDRPQARITGDSAVAQLELVESGHSREHVLKVQIRAETLAEVVPRLRPDKRGDVIWGKRSHRTIMMRRGPGA